MTVVDHDSVAVDQARSAALARLGALDQPRNQTLDALARLAAYVCGTPTAQINLLDSERQWPAAAYGGDAVEVPIDQAMCSTSIRSRDVSYTSDASADPRWADNPFVTGTLDRMRLYAAAPLILPGGEVVGTVCAFSPDVKQLSRLQLERLRDVADQTVLLLELREQAARLGHAATRDVLTGLPNRALFEESLRLALAKQHRGGPKPMVVFIDLDHFKLVNDTHGHAIGDELLRAVADRLLETVRVSDLLCRLSGDELVVLCETADGAGSAALLARLRAAFSTGFALSCGTIEIGASIGMAVADDDTAVSLLDRADAEMYRDKHERRQASAALR